MKAETQNSQIDSEHIVFIHIPKAAGTSANHFFQNAYGKDKVGWLGMNFNAEQLQKSNIQSLAEFKVIGGHFPYSTAATFPWRNTYIAVLRDPISRAISLYRYIQRIETHPLHNTANSVNMLEMLSSTPQFRVQVSNLQANWLSSAEAARGGKGTSETALENIHYNKFFVSTIASVNLLFEKIKEKLSLPADLSYGKQNTSPELIDRDPLWEDKSLVSLLKEINNEDTKLFNHIESLPNQILLTIRP